MKDTPQLRTKVFSLFPFLKNAGHEIQTEFFEHGNLTRFESRQPICVQEDKRTCVPFILEGTARVYKLGQSGREITLYRIHPGQCGIMIAVCTLSHKPFPAFTAAETEVQAVLIAPDVLHRWFDEFRPWREFVCSMLASRFSEVIAVIEEVAFQRVEVRTAEYLLEAIPVNGAILKTHQDIATDIGTAREVVSRVLKGFEHRGFIRLFRGKIHPDKPEELEKLAYQSVLREPESADLN